MTGSRWGAWTGVVFLVMAALAMVAIPVFLIRPFAPQTPMMLDLAFVLRRWSPLVTLVALAGVLLLAKSLWRESTGWIRRPALVVAGVAVVGATWGARQNHFEWMFAPLPNAGYVRSTAANFVRPTDNVLAVTRGADAAAYPVNQLAYHHLVEDAIGGVPIVATY